MLLIILLTGLTIASIAQKRDKFYNAMEISFLSLNALDLGTTLYGLDNGAVEANPFIKNASPFELIAFKAVTTTALLGAGRLMYKRDVRGAKTFMVTMNIILTAVVINNATVVVNLNK